MPGAGTIERLQHFLRDLPPQARALLIQACARDLGGDDSVIAPPSVPDRPGASARNGGAPAARLGRVAQAFFRPLTPFLVDDRPDHKHPGRIAFQSLAPLWNWIRRDLLPDVAAELAAQASDPLAPATERGLHDHVVGFQERAAAAIAAAFAAAADEDDGCRRLLAGIGTPRAEADGLTLLHVLDGRDRLARLAADLPPRICELDASVLAHCRLLIDRTVADADGLFLYALIVIMRRLAAPWQLVRLAVHAAGTKVAARVAATRHAVAVDVILAELERQIGALGRWMRTGTGEGGASLLKLIDDGLHGLSAELALPTDSSWGRSLRAQRMRLAALLGAEVAMLPARTWRLLAPPRRGHPRCGDAHEATTIAAMLELVGHPGVVAGEPVLRDVAAHARAELSTCLEAAIRDLLDGIRTADVAEHRVWQWKLAAARRFGAVLFGEVYADGVARAVDIVCGSERAAANG